MAKDICFRWKPAGYYEFMNSSGVTADIKRRAEAVASSANEGRSADTMTHEPFGADVEHGSKKVLGFAHTKTPHGEYAQAKYDCLQSALDSARG